MKNPWEDLPQLDTSSRPVFVFDRPPSASGQRLGQRLVQVHDHIREETKKLLAVVAEVIEGRESVQAAQSALKSLSLRQSYPGLGGFCSGYCELLRIHHTIEDHQVFPSLGATHPGLQPVLKQLYLEHEVVAELITRLDESLALSEQDPHARGYLERFSAVLAEHIESHLAYEESQLVKVLDSAENPGAPRGDA